MPCGAVGRFGAMMKVGRSGAMMKVGRFGDPILNPPPKAANGVACVFQKPWRLATEVR